jgi:hypothetical protein
VPVSRSLVLRNLGEAMKRIHHTPDIGPRNEASPYRAHKLYEVHLGNGRILQFRSRRLALAYIADLTRWLNELVLECNSLLGDAMQDYRAAWPMLSEAQDQAERVRDITIRELQAQAVHHLDKATTRMLGTSAFYHAWQHVRRALGAVASSYENLEFFYRYKTQGVPRWRCALRRRQCLEAIKRMDEMGGGRGLIEPGPKV